ncbi:PTS sugar transporter subunit IIA [Eubacteriales bacterium OttesenSCG-928-M02]|nr:PTS sugar transporter subunit IIA [Eubacteriales bacterium OttesenSCG-928-M02]
MIHVLVAAHAGLARSIIVSSDLIMGPQEHVHFIEFLTGVTIDTLTRRFFDVYHKLDAADELLILVDIYGGSVGNVAAAFLGRLSHKERERIECVSGVNLTMLMTALEAREELSLLDLKRLCIERGKAAVKDMKQEFKL